MRYTKSASSEESNITLDSVKDFDARSKFSLDNISYSDGGDQHQGMTVLVRSDSWEGYGVEDWDDCKPRPKKPQHRSARTHINLLSITSRNRRSLEKLTKPRARGRRSYTSKKNAPTMKTGTVRYFSQSPGLVASQIPSAMITNDINCTFKVIDHFFIHRPLQWFRSKGLRSVPLPECWSILWRRHSWMQGDRTCNRTPHDP